MKNIFKLIIIMSFFICVLGYIWYDYVSLENEQFVSPREPKPINARKIKIGIIGESWAAGRKIDDYLINFLNEKGIEASVTSQGHPGAKSKLVYQDLFKASTEPYSSQHILFGEPLDICIVLTGVNDTATYVGAEFYAYHLTLIVKALIARGITPLVVEIPEYGIEETDSKTIQGKIRRRLMRYVHDNNKIDIIPKYRKLSKRQIEPYMSNNKIIYFPFETVATDYQENKNLYQDDLVHLNANGNKKLAFQISNVIIKWIIEGN